MTIKNFLYLIGAHEIKYINDKGSDNADMVYQEGVKGNTYVSTHDNEVGAYHASFSNIDVSTKGVMGRGEFPDSTMNNTYVSTSPHKPPSKSSKKGTYDLCGVTACGSLRTPDGDHTYPESMNYDHGLYAYLENEERELQLLNLPVIHDGLGAVSKGTIFF